MSNRMFLRNLGLTLVTLGAVVLAGGCPAYQARSTFDYEVNQVVMAGGQPEPAGQAVRSQPELASNPEIRIDPEAATGYESLPEEISQLYGPSPRLIGIQDIVRQTLANNRNIKIQGYTLEIAEYQVPVSKSIYDLLLGASGQVSKSKEETRLDFAALEAQADAFGGVGSFFGIQFLNTNRQRLWDATATQLLPTGAQLELAYAFSQTFSDPNSNSLNPIIDHAVTLSLTQPLLKGFGPEVTNADIHIAQEQYKASSAEFEIEVQNSVREALDFYWDLVSAVHRFDVQVISYVAALELLRVNQAYVDVGAKAPTEALQARAAAEERREQVIRARQDVRDVEDQLKQLIFFQSEGPAWVLELLPTQELSWREIEIDATRVLAEALSERPEIRIAESQVDQSDLELIKSRNARLPSLDLRAVAGITGRGDRSSLARRDLETADFNNFLLGLELSYPLQNRQARFQHRQRLTERETAIERLLQTQETVVFEVRASVRDLRTSREVIDVTRSRVESEQANVDAEQKKMDAGISTSFEVLEFQEDLAQGQEAYIRAVIDYNKAAIALELARGTVLSTYGIAIDSPTFRPATQKVVFPVGFE